MLAKTIHISRGKTKRKIPVYLKNKPYYFRVPKDLESKVKEGSLVVGNHRQELYVVELEKRPKEEEESYSGELKKVIPNVSFVLENKHKSLKKKNRRAPLKERAVFKGRVLELTKKKFEKTAVVIKVKSTHRVWGKLQIGDIARVIHTNKNGVKTPIYVMIQEILTDVPRKERPAVALRRIDDRYYYKKTAKGYKKTRYIPKPFTEIKATEITEKQPKKKAKKPAKKKVEQKEPVKQVKQVISPEKPRFEIRKRREP